MKGMLSESLLYRLRMEANSSSAEPPGERAARCSVVGLEQSVANEACGLDAIAQARGCVQGFQLEVTGRSRRKECQ